jgi:phage-related protein
MFIRYYLTLTAPTPKAEQDAARIMGNQRFEAFVAQVGKRIAGGISSMGEVLEKASGQEPDVQRRDPDKTLLDEMRNAQ